MDTIEKPVTRKDGYHDFYFRVIIALLAAHLIIAFGEKESFFQLLVMPAYYWSLLPSFVIAFLLVNFVNFITVKLDKKHDWMRQPLLRAGLQLTLALLLPAVLAFLLASVYFWTFGYNIFKTLYLKYDFPVIVLLLVLLNAYYLSFYFYKRSRIAEKTLSHPVAAKDENSPGETAAKEIFLVQRGAQTLPLSVFSIAYFYREGDYNFLKAFDGESYLVAQTLDEIEQQLDSRVFFRANRQVIVQRKACTRYSNLEYGKLELFAQPSFKHPVIISQRRSKQFREWIQG
ncbi:MAG: LytTR family transcriptional regulator [Bacteroidetes bacterium]|nr:LytTR family transcriptional regulator [Bacteroidota bacterium]